ncbi:hypothetical protein NLS1_10400 [Nocardioides sp. LS1]|nr:hypothetical protein NLS1_10400 [Nocardioides sp. LS1]
MGLVPDQGDRLVTGGDEGLVEESGHLSVAPDDCDMAHAPRLYGAAPAAT